MANRRSAARRSSAKGGLEVRQKHTEYVKAKARVSLAERKRVNSSKPCAVSGCDRNREDLYPYCLKHTRRYRNSGHPVIDIQPRPHELRAVEDAIKEWLDKDHLTTKADREAFKHNWSAGQRTIHHHPSYALPFSRLEGRSGYTQKAKGWVILSHYFHRQGNSLSDAMLRYMAVRLWTEFKWRLPEGSRKGLQAERQQFVNTWAGKFVFQNSGFYKTVTEQKVIAWERPWYVSENPRDNLPKPITETVTTKKTMTAWCSATAVRAIGDELRVAVEQAMGTHWVSRDHRLLHRAGEALDLPNSTPSIHQHFEQN